MLLTLNYKIAKFCNMEIMLIRYVEPDYKMDTLKELGHAQAKALARSIAKVERALFQVSFQAELRGKTEGQFVWTPEIERR